MAMGGGGQQGLFAGHLPAIEAALVGAALVELRADVLVIHGDER